jgi:L-serine dehydratase
LKISIILSNAVITLMPMHTGIFNDVIGPVMRGPSSSHTAAAHRIGSMIRQFFEIKGSKVTVEFHREGSLATTYDGQGSSMGLISGLAGVSILDPEMMNYRSMPGKEGFKIEFIVSDYEANHPNTYKVSIETSEREKGEIIAVSTGGGMFEIRYLNGFPVMLRGDCYETLLCLGPVSKESINELERGIKEKYRAETGIINSADNNLLLRIKSREPLINLADELINDNVIVRVFQAHPVLPVMPEFSKSLPFSTLPEMLDLAQKENLDLAGLAVLYESRFAGIEEAEVRSMMHKLVLIIKSSISSGLKDNYFSDRILGHQSHLIAEAEKAGKIITTPLNTVTAYVTAIMESKSSMEVIVAAPTAGSAGAIGGAIFAIGEFLNSGTEKIVDAYLAAGLTGVLIADKYTFAAEEGGCQVECGAASAMAASGLVQLMGGSAQQALSAASMALQNCLGMICDPVADRVEVPCLGKNILAATNAFTCANMIIAGYDSVIPFDEVIDAMKSVGSQLPRALCCTGAGGLSQSPASKRIFSQLASRKNNKSLL